MKVIVQGNCFFMGGGGGGGGGRHWSFLGVLYFLKSWPCWFPSYLAYRSHQFHASRNARKCKALLKRVCTSMQVRASLETCTDLHPVWPPTCTDLHRLASYLNVFKFSCKPMQVYHRLATQRKSMQVFRAVIETCQPMTCPKFPGNDDVVWLTSYSASDPTQELKPRSHRREIIKPN